MDESEKVVICRRCSECANNSHHWISSRNIDYDLPSHACKHCEAMGDECLRCDGTGESVAGVQCDTCNGEGVVLAPITIVEVWCQMCNWQGTVPCNEMDDCPECGEEYLIRTSDPAE